MEKRYIYVLSSDLSKWKEKKHPCVDFRLKQMEKNIRVLSSGLSKWGENIHELSSGLRKLKKKHQGIVFRLK